MKLQDLLEAPKDKNEDEPKKSKTTTKERTKVGEPDILSQPHSKGDLAKTSKEEPGEEPTETKHRAAAASTTAKRLKNVNIHDAPAIHADEVDTSGETDDGYLPSTTKNLPAIISKAIKHQSKALEKEHPANVEWHMVRHLPGMLQKVIRAIGREVFKPFTRTPIEDIQVIAHVGGGPNSEKEIDIISKAVSHAGDRVKDAELYFHKIIPDYEAKVVVYNAFGFTFMFVKDFAGSYIYSWPEKDTKQDEFHARVEREPAKRIGHDRPQLTHEKDLADLMKKYGV